MDDLNRVYSVQTTPALRAMAGTSLKGTWTLRLVDSWRFDEGKLRSWRIDALVTSMQPLVVHAGPASPSQVGEPPVAQAAPRRP